jgi:hypothetical protein
MTINEAFPASLSGPLNNFPAMVPITSLHTGPVEGNSLGPFLMIELPEEGQELDV